MHRSLAICFVLSAAGSLLPALVRAEVQEVAILASAHDSPREACLGPVRFSAPGGMAIRSAEELAALSSEPAAARDAARQKALEAELARVLEVSGIDWNKQMVLAVQGTPGTRLDRVHFESVTLDGKVLTVAWKVKQRPPHAGPGTPVALILVERCEGEVKFVEVGQK
jgi:hypothetical protein